MPTLRLRFPGRRYHATPWGHHVNEGLVEWPPSPWRMLRALLATGYTKLHWPAAGAPPAARSLIEKLAASAPSYRLPAAVGTHTRHYMPLARFKNGREDTTLVFDTWAQVDEGELAVHWPAALTADETHTLAALAQALGYLGRAESWVEAELTPDGADESWPVVVDDAAPAPGSGWEQVSLLAPVAADQYAAWRLGALEQARARTGVDLHKARHTAAEKKKLAIADQSLPADLIACLQADTPWLHRLGWSQPPGTRRLLYRRPADSLEAGAPKPRRALAPPPAVPCMLLGIAAAGRVRGALPSVQRALPQSELLHQALVWHASRAASHSAVLTGCDAQRRPLTTPHQHAHLLHLDLDGDGHLDHALVWAPMGLDADAQAAVRATRRTYTKGGLGELRLNLVGIGDWHDLLRLPEPMRGSLAALAGYPPSTRWRSVTPFVPPRHLKANGRNSLTGQVNAELAARNLPAAKVVTVLDAHQEEGRRLRHYKRVRARGLPPPQDAGFALDLQFDAPIAGPVALGYASHYGLGLFRAVS